MIVFNYLEPEFADKLARRLVMFWGLVIRRWPLHWDLHYGTLVR